MLSCKDVTEKANQYIDRELSLITRLRVQLHLFVCVNCRQYLKQLQLTIQTLRKMPEPTTPEPSEEKISEIIASIRKQSASDQTPPGDHH